MRLFLYEIKKIFNWKNLLILLFVNFIVYSLFISFNLEYFPNGRPAKDYVKIEKEIIPLYGAHLSAAEAADMQKRLHKVEATGDAYLSNNAEAVALNLDSFEKFNAVDSETSTKEENAFAEKVVFESKEDFSWENQAYESLIEIQNDRRLIDPSEYENPTQRKRVDKLLKEEKFYMYSHIVPFGFKDYTIGVSSVLFLSVIILISPIFLRNQQAGLLPLQYTSKIGRKMYRLKWLAGLVSSFITSSTILAIYGGLYLTNDTSSHFGLPLYTFAYSGAWYEITFLQFIFLTLGLALLYSLLVTALSMIISTVVRNYTSLIAIQIVVAFFSIYLVANYALPFSISIRFQPFVMPITWLAMTILTLLGSFFIRRREGERDIE